MVYGDVREEQRVVQRSPSSTGGVRGRGLQRCAWGVRRVQVPRQVGGWAMIGGDPGQTRPENRGGLETGGTSGGGTGIPLAIAGSSLSSGGQEMPL